MEKLMKWFFNTQITSNHYKQPWLWWLHQKHSSHMAWFFQCVLLVQSAWLPILGPLILCTLVYRLQIQCPASRLWLETDWILQVWSVFLFFLQNQEWMEWMWNPVCREKTASSNLTFKRRMGFLLTDVSATFYWWFCTIQCPAGKRKSGLSLSRVEQWTINGWWSGELTDWREMRVRKRGALKKMFYCCCCCLFCQDS